LFSIAILLLPACRLVVAGFSLRGHMTLPKGR
jgi:hypothetical protein